MGPLARGETETADGVLGVGSRGVAEMREPADGCSAVEMQGSADECSGTWSCAEMDWPGAEEVGLVGESRGADGVPLVSVSRGAEAEDVDVDVDVGLVGGSDTAAAVRELANGLSGASGCAGREGLLATGG